MSNRVPTGWSTAELGGFCEGIQGVTYKPDDLSSSKTGSTVTLLRSNNIKDGSLNFIAVQHVSETKVKKRQIAKAGDIAVCMSNGSKRLVGKSATFNYISKGHRYTVGAFCSIFRPHDSVCSGFVAQLFNSDQFQKQVDFSLAGSAINNLKNSDLVAYQFLEPPLPEQQKIATILSSVDDVIEKTRAQIDKLKDLKTGMMQELLTKGIGHTEFKDSPVGRIPASWSVVPLDSVVSTMESGWSPQCESNPARSGEWAILKTTAVTWSGFDFRANKKLPEQLEPRPAIQVEPHDILITRAGPSERVGVVSYVAYVPSRIMLSDKLIRIKANQDQNPQFLSFWLSTEFVRNFFAQRTTGLAQSQTNISQEILKSVPCAIPPLAEQNVISNAIAALERELNLKREILQHKKSLKKSLMQDLLTGKVRVKLTDKESAVV